MGLLVRTGVIVLIIVRPPLISSIMIAIVTMIVIAFVQVVPSRGIAGSRRGPQRRGPGGLQSLDDGRRSQAGSSEKSGGLGFRV